MQWLQIQYSLGICSRHADSKTEQSFNNYFQKRKYLRMDCNFAAVSAIQHKEEAVRDAFISWLALPEIRQRILEKKQHLDLQATLAMARSSKHCLKEMKCDVTHCSLHTKSHT